MNTKFAAVMAEYIIRNISQDFAFDEERWITIYPNGKGAKKDGTGDKSGFPVLIDGDNGEIKGGMGGKFTGRRISEINKNFVGAPTEPKNVRSVRSSLSKGEGLSLFDPKRKELIESLAKTPKGIEINTKDGVYKSLGEGDFEDQYGNKTSQHIVLSSMQKDYLPKKDNAAQNKTAQKDEPKTEAESQSRQSEVEQQNKQPQGAPLDDFDQARIDRRQRQIESAQRQLDEAKARFGELMDIMGRIPAGQPIISKEYARFHKKLSNRTDAAVEKISEAKEKLEQAKSVAKSDLSISGLDPNAISKLDKEITRRQENWEKMKKLGKETRGITDPKILAQKIKEANLDDDAKEHVYVDKRGLMFFDNYRNNTLRLKKRKESLEKLGSSTKASLNKDYGKFEVKTDTGENRINIYFGGKPDENTRSILKRNGFKYSPTREAWTRQRTANAEYSAKKVIEELTKDS